MIAVMKTLAGLLSWVLLLAFSPIVYSDIGWDVSGFATVAAGKTNRDELLYMDYDGDWSVDSDTMLGLQLVLEPLDRLSLTTQVVTRGHSFDDVGEYSTEIEWAFASYNLSDRARLRAGRLRTPYQYYSESLEVGYSYVWVRPPPNVYAFLFEPFSHFDGVDLSYTYYGDQVDLEFKGLYGSQEGAFLETRVDIDQIWGVTLTSRWQDLTLRYGFLNHSIDLTIPAYDPLLDAFDATAAGFAAFGIPDPGFVALKDRYGLDDASVRYHSLALDWRLGHWNLIAERYELVRPDKNLENGSRGWYLSLARQIREFTPYVVVGAYKSAVGQGPYQQLDATFDSVEPFYPLLPVPVAQQLAADLAELRFLAEFGLDRYVVGQRSYTTGLRWDFHSSTALKTELEYIEFTRGSTGHAVGKTIPFDRQSDSNDLLSITIALEVVF